jgi:hypothetical protein
VPTPDVIRAGLTAIANEWRALAIAWHVVFGLAIVSVGAGWRPSQRAAACGLSLPLVSVSALAWQSGNPFNTLVFAFLALVLFGIALTMPSESIRVAARPVSVVGGLLLIFGWTYPHFVTSDRWTTYLYASPLGLVPCPTLATLIGMSLVLELFRAVRWSAMLAVAGLVYGAIGVFKLRVALDYGLLAGAVVIAVAIASGPHRQSAFSRRSVTARSTTI